MPDELDSVFVLENCRTTTFVFSPSGKYRAEVSTYNTGATTWDVSRAVVYHVHTGVQIADIKRNYPHMPLTWVEGHSNGHDYLITGKLYYGQTVVELTSEARREYPEDPTGNEYCWSTVQPLADGRTLAVIGCYWGAPGHYEFFDFSDPMSGWPELPVEPDLRLDDDGLLREDAEGVVWSSGSWIHTSTGQTEREIEIETHPLSVQAMQAANAGDTVRAEELRAAHLQAWIDHEDAPDQFHFEEDHVVRLVRDGNVMRVVSETKSERLLAAEQKRAEWAERHKAKSAQLRAECPRIEFILQRHGVEGERDRHYGTFHPSAYDKANGDENYLRYTYAVVPQSLSDVCRRRACFTWGATHGSVAVTYDEAAGDAGWKCTKKFELSRDMAEFEAAWAEAENFIEKGLPLGNVQ